MSTSDNHDSKTKDWSDYYNATKNNPPRPLLVKALEHVATKNKAIDIGAGGLNDTRYLLHEGFEVTAIDSSPTLLQAVELIPSDRLHAAVTTFDSFDFGVQEYNLASAMLALPFNPPDSFDQVFANIRQSIVPGGIFCGQFFGVNDEWSSNGQMTFHTKEQVENLLVDIEIIHLIEKEEDGTTAIGTPKHWHVFHVIARKR